VLTLGFKEVKGVEIRILDVQASSAEELIKHTAGPGTRYVFSYHNNNPEGTLYIVVRVVENLDHPEPHMETHSHENESMFIFKGSNPDLSGLEVEVLLGEKWSRIESPKAVRIPPGQNHNCRLLRGSGEIWNIVIAPGAEYNKTVR
jgi:2-isopropylmalate synthase